MARQHFDNSPSPTGAGTTEEQARLLDRVEARGVRFINLEFTDVVGMAKSVTIPAVELADCLARGKWFDGSALEGFARVAETDMYLRPDLATYAEVPWRAAADGDGDRVARLICDVLMPDGQRFAGDPRAMLIAALDAAAGLGLRYEVSPELEFFLLRESEGIARDPLPHDRGGYFDLSTDVAADVRREMVSELGTMGIRVESSHHEVAAGQHELDFAPADALAMADAMVTARYAIKAIAQRHGLWATFLPKPFHGINGSGMHTHQQLTRMSDGANAFADPGDAQYALSALGRHFIAGQLAHAPGSCAIVAPLVNSYKRLVPGYEAPVMITWGRVNREALVRVPRVAGSAAHTLRVELRSPDPSCNPCRCRRRSKRGCTRWKSRRAYAGASASCRRRWPTRWRRCRAIRCCWTRWASRSRRGSSTRSRASGMSIGARSTRGSSSAICRCTDRRREAMAGGTR